MHEHSTIFLVSDRTGITVENLVRTLLTQFDQVLAERIVRPFLDTPQKIASVVEEIDRAAEEDEAPPLVYSSMVDGDLREQLKQCRGMVFDIFDAFLPSMSEALHMPSSRHVGRAHGISNLRDYDKRVEAVNFALAFDDGARIKGLQEADLILIGVSRTGKTPTCLYLAMQYKVLAANYPLTEEDFMEGRLPQPLIAHQDKLFGLSIASERLHQIREERRPGSNYASIAQCRREVTAAENLYRNKRIPFIDSTAVSIEELAIEIMQLIGVKRFI
jgi:[pyruvate, water dikinase]-phosphate phosphotransferase / [pyruvate, water dikinase] kinase